MPQRGRGNGYGIPDAYWTPELISTLRQRVQDCASTLSRDERSFRLAAFRVAEPDLLHRGEAARRQRDALVARKNSFFNRIVDAQKLAPPERVQALAQLHAGLAASGLLQPDQIEVAGALVQARLAAEAVRDAHEVEARRAEEAGKAHADAEAERLKRALEARLAGLSAPVRAFVSRNAGLIDQPSDDARAWLRGLYAMETSLRICARETGRYGRELGETTRRRLVFEGYLVEFHKTDPAVLKRERDAYGVETGTGRAADMLSADRLTVRGACDAALAWSSGFFDFGG